MKVSVRKSPPSTTENTWANLIKTDIVLQHSNSPPSMRHGPSGPTRRYLQPHNGSRSSYPFWKIYLDSHRNNSWVGCTLWAGDNDCGGARPQGCRNYPNTKNTFWSVDGRAELATEAEKSLFRWPDYPKPSWVATVGIPICHLILVILQIYRIYLSIGLYPSKIRWRALDILTTAMVTYIDNANAVLAQLVSWPSVELRLFLKQLAATKLGPKWALYIYGIILKLT